MKPTNTIQALVLVATALGMGGCIKSWKPLMDAEMISMTKSGIDGAKVKSLGEVEEEFCFEPGDDAEDAMTYKSGDATVGVVDEVVYRAQKQKGADALKMVSIEHSGACVRLTGTAVKAL